MENLSTALSVVAVLAEPLGENATLIGPVHYQSFAASRFARASFAYFHLEDFENGILDTFNALAPHGMVLQPAGQAAPAEAEDDSTDNSHLSRNTWYADGDSILTFSFSKELLGELPTDAGLIWTDMGLANIRGGLKACFLKLSMRQIICWERSAHPRWEMDYSQAKRRKTGSLALAAPTASVPYE